MRRATPVTGSPGVVLAGGGLAAVAAARSIRGAGL